MSIDPHAVLGLSPGATPEEVRAAYCSSRSTRWGGPGSDVCWASWLAGANASRSAFDQIAPPQPAPEPRSPPRDRGFAFRAPEMPGGRDLDSAEVVASRAVRAANARVAGRPLAGRWGRPADPRFSGEDRKSVV